ncbi:MAG: glutathione reductase [Peptostreptococcaceae bacterium]|nr:glutathione reductase [Peptostreptococcaceae bacterium]
MQKIYSFIKSFLENSEDVDTFIESGAIIWIDWREYDEDIISFVNEKIEDKVEVEHIFNNKPYGDDICLKYKNKSLIIPYEEKMDRDTTIKYLNEFIKPKYEIRFCMESLGNDTLAFCLLEENLWNELEKKFGLEKVRFYFEKIDVKSNMFNLDVDTVFKLIDERNKTSIVEKN